MARILAVDDSPTILHLIADMLTSGGHDVLRAMDGKTALQMAIDEQPDLVLLDVILPKLNGYEVCRELKSQPETSHIAVVMMSRKSREEDRQWGLEQGADGYLTKPFNDRDLLAAISDHLQTIEA